MRRILRIWIPLNREVNQALTLDNPHHLNRSSHLQKMGFEDSGFLVR